MSWFGVNQTGEEQQGLLKQPQSNPSNPHYVKLLNSMAGVDSTVSMDMTDPNSIRKLQSLEHCFINCISAFSVGDRVVNAAVNTFRRNFSRDADKKSKMNSNKEYRQKMIIKALENVLARARADPNIGSVSVSNTIKGDFTQLSNVTAHGLTSILSGKSPQNLPVRQGGKKRKGSKTRKHVKKSK